MDKFSTAERFFISLGMLCVKLALCLSIAGCGVASVLTHDGSGLATAIVLVADADVRLTKPELPDSLGKQDVGAAPTAASIKPYTKSLLLVSQKGCAPCQREIEQVIPVLKKSGWIVKSIGERGTAHIWLVDADRHSDIVQAFGTPTEDGRYEIPQWVLMRSGAVLMRNVGFKSAAEIGEFWRSK